MATNHKTITYRRYNNLDIHFMGINMNKPSYITSNNNRDVEQTTNSWTSEIASILDRYCKKKVFQPVWLSTKYENSKMKLVPFKKIVKFYQLNRVL